ncbi:MAG: cell division protein ZapD [Gammaproteobacteria bacterium]|jgi:cell division protein ZapD
MPPKHIIFEQPLNERIRMCLRIETLMKRFHYFTSLKGDWSGYTALLGIIEITSLLERIDLKQELMKELERQHSALKSLSAHKGVDKSKLILILSQQKDALERLHQLNGKLGEHLKRNDFLLAIKQRTSIPGGSCDFDLPALRFWLNQDHTKRVVDLEQWAGPYLELESVIELVLSVIRDSAMPEKVVAENGFFHQSLDSQQLNQLLRISIPVSEEIYPEVSAGKHRYSVRFLSPLPIDDLPSQVKEDVTFWLTRCSL